MSTYLKLLVCALRFLSWTNSVQSIDCPCGWTSLGSSCYFFGTTKITWRNARADCLRRGGDLAVPMNVNEDTAIWNEVKRRRLDNPFIGIARSYIDNQFYTVYGSKLQYKNWRQHEPNPFSEHCGSYWTLTSNGRFGWNNIQCNGHTFNYICELRRSRC